WPRDWSSDVALPIWELEDLEGMPIGIVEVEGADAARLGVPIREPLRRPRHALHAMRLEHRVGPLHVAHDDGDVLEPAVVAVCARGSRAPRRVEPGHELERLVA